ncbi:hypothetical protein MOO23_07335 [Rhodococcus opacus]|nr:hypothetical protein [Rhodococcus opacus]UNN02242.1 hypothetical protein MOO23_07335 [Rhodococcus opacus]
MPDRSRWSARVAVAVLAACTPLAAAGAGSAEPFFRDQTAVDASEFGPLCTPDDSGVGTPDEASLEELSGLVSADCSTRSVTAGPIARSR